MVSLATLRRVLAVDLRMSAGAIDEVLAGFATTRSEVLPLEEALAVLEHAEALSAQAA